MSIYPVLGSFSIYPHHNNSKIHAKLEEKALSFKGSGFGNFIKRSIKDRLSNSRSMANPAYQTIKVFRPDHDALIQILSPIPNKT